MNAKIFPSNEVCMDGKELRRLRMAAGLSDEQLATKLGVGWYRKRIQRLEDSKQFCLHPSEMEALLRVLGLS